MKVLYYCPEYYFRHGGRTHARGFFAALQKLPSVSESFLLPKATAVEEAGDSDSSGTGKRGKLWFLPPTVRKIVQFFIPRKRLTHEVIGEINAHGCNALVIRTGARQPLVGMIKRACPQTTICLEVNSAFFDEQFPGLPMKWLFQQWEVSRFRQADAVVVVSSYLKDYLQKRGMPADRILVNQNGVNTDLINLDAVPDVRDSYGIPKDAFVVGYIGGMETFRRLPEVIARIAALRRAGHHDVYLLMVGDGSDMPRVKEAVAADYEVLENAVTLTGWVPHAEVTGYLASFDLAIFPFTNDYCSPLKLFEYLGAGLATLGPDTPAVREVFQDDVHLKLVKQDGTDFIEKIMQIKNDPGLGSGLGRAGQKLVLEEYTWEKNAQRVIAHILRFAGAVPAAAR